MKMIVALFFIVLALPVIAQSYGGMSEAQMQQMMLKMGEVQACYEKVDKSSLAKMAEEAQFMEAELKQLCTNNERDKAQAKAISYGMAYSSRPELQQLRQCAEIAQNMMPSGLMPETPDFANPETYKNQHVCDPF